MNIDRLKGTGVALITPLNEDTSIDYEGLKKLLHHVSDGGVEYLLVMGTTGESPTFSWEEKLEVLQFVFDNNPKNLPIVMGHGGNNTADLVRKLDDLKKFDLAALLSASPYYSKPSQEGIYRHYMAIADASTFPVILYNVPGRTSSNVTAETTVRLSAHPNIVAIKEASGNLDQMGKIIAHAPDDFLLFSGDDGLTLSTIALGGCGIVSVIANLLPREFSDMVRAAMRGDYAEAKRLNLSLLDAYELMSREGNPVSIKKGLEVAGITKSAVRLPLFAASDKLGEDFKAYLGI